MILTVKQLQSIIDMNPVGDTFPYFGGSEQDIENHLKAVVATLRHSPLLDVEAEFNHYGSGYASYVHVFCAKSNRQSTVRRGDTDWIDGISDLAPIRITLDLVKSSAIKLQPFFWLLSVK
ncbi:MAG: hypothetical protein KME57_11195 [Scytonema hyalinum WJT4-NPBG1]|jgi:hypothetical protein|nr:hypothetical protein [Scytonema hyalinum WJT4-NPBG1]